MKRSANEPGDRGREAQRKLDDALRSLGLRPHGTQLKGDRTRTDQLDKVRDAGRFDPPPGWTEQFREYTHGVNTQGRR